MYEDGHQCSQPGGPYQQITIVKRKIVNIDPNWQSTMVERTIIDTDPSRQGMVVERMTIVAGLNRYDTAVEMTLFTSMMGNSMSVEIVIVNIKVAIDDSLNRGWPSRGMVKIDSEDL